MLGQTAPEQLQQNAQQMQYAARQFLQGEIGSDEYRAIRTEYGSNYEKVAVGVVLPKTLTSIWHGVCRLLGMG